MLGEFSRIPLEALLASGAEVCGVVIPASRADMNRPESIVPIMRPTKTSELPLVSYHVTPSILQVAGNFDIPAFELIRPGDVEVGETLRALEPDVALVACFPWILPQSLLSLPPKGFLNLHPSLLPSFRGPHPLFWIFREGIRDTGVTVHFMDQGVDSGDIALQASLDLPDGISGAEADRLHATLGANLFVEAIQLLRSDGLARKVQEGVGSTYPAPRAADFSISTNWCARRAFNFMRGTDTWRLPYRVEIGETTILLKRAISYERTGKVTRPFKKKRRDAIIRFSPGVLKAELL
jgi:methionyl-tRNA formyltransferase